MMHGGFKIDYRNLRIFCERAQDWISSFFFPILQSRKRSHADRYTITTKHTHKLRDMLGLVSIHHYAFAMLECPTGSARFEHNGISAKLRNPDLHRRARSQAGIEKNQRHRAPGQRSIMLPAFEPQR